MSPLDRLTQELAKLPGIGEKTALRLVLYILRQPSHYTTALSEALTQAVEKIKFCSLCFHITDLDPCRICANPDRNHGITCVVEESSDLLALERTHYFKGIYHVLQGNLSPLDGIGPEKLRVRELLERLQKQAIHEIILATNPNVTGDATALYLSKLIKPMGIRITKLAAGLPVGADIQYADQVTLARALEARREF